MCWNCMAAQCLSFLIHGRACNLVTMSLLSLPSPEINNGVETTDELSLCSENGYANEMVTPTDHRDTKLRMN